MGEAAGPVPPDIDLVQGMARRDRGCFGQFYDRHASRVFGLLCKMLGQPAEAEDILQESFLQVWQQAGSYDPGRGSPPTWLTLIARSRAIDRLRKVALEKRREGRVIEELNREIEGAGSLQEEIAKKGEREIVLDALGALPRQQRDPILLAFFDGLTHAEIAKRSGEPLGTIKTRIRLGMRKLGETFQQKGVTAGG